MSSLKQWINEHKYFDGSSEFLTENYIYNLAKVIQDELELIKYVNDGCTDVNCPQHGEFHYHTAPKPKEQE